MTHYLYRNDSYPRLTNGTGTWREMVTRSRVRMMQRLCALPFHARGLEVGCDHAVMLRMLESCGLEMHGIDVNEDAIRIAAHPRIRLGSADMIPYPDTSFDVCIASHVIEHLPDPSALIREARRILKQGGKLVLIYPWELFRGMTIIPDVFIHRR